MGSNKRGLTIACAALGLMALEGGAAAVGAKPPKAPEGMKLVWSDEFDKDGAPDPAKWNFERGFARNEEAQWYQPDNARVRNGMLVIEARRERRPNPNYKPGSGDWRTNREFIEYTSSSLTTSGKGAWTYLGGHDPEDPQHAIGSAPTDLALHPNSPGYRLILNNVLFPAAKKRKQKT